MFYTVTLLVILEIFHINSENLFSPFNTPFTDVYIPIFMDTRQFDARTKPYIFLKKQHNYTLLT